jgi:hypothetical protein
MQHYFLSIQNLFDMLVNIKIKQKKKQVIKDLLLDQHGIFRTTTLSWLSFEKLFLSQIYKA